MEFGEAIDWVVWIFFVFQLFSKSFSFSLFFSGGFFKKKDRR